MQAIPRSVLHIAKNALDNILVSTEDHQTILRYSVESAASKKITISAKKCSVGDIGVNIDFHLNIRAGRRRSSIHLLQ
jgi:hypothetical protein